MAASLPVAGKCRWRMACALCAGRGLIPVLELAATPPATALVGESGLDRPQPRYPLELVLCETCGHVQLGHIVDRFEVLGRPVDPVAAVPAMVDHLHAAAAEAIDRFAGATNALAIDVGANDGTFLKAFERAGWRVQGIEASVNVAGAAIDDGIPTFPGFFMLSTAHRILEERGRATVVAARQPFVETEDADDFVAGVRLLLKPDGLFVFEVGALAALVETAGFDAVTHAALGYHSVAPLRRFFAARGMELIEVRRTPLGRGSLRGVVQHAGGPHRADGSVETMVADERRLALDDPAMFQRLARRIAMIKEQVAARIDTLTRDRRRLAGAGAGPGSTTLLHQLDIGRDVIDFIVDESPLRQGRFTPGLHIPVTAPETVEQRRPDVVMILAWPCSQAIVARHAGYREAGGRFLVPLPEPMLF
jgi:hypothetical protein